MCAMPERPLTYGDYLKVPELLALQKVLSSPAHHDEPLFIIIHQVYELWFKLILHEVDAAGAHLRADRVTEATRLLRRVVEAIGQVGGETIFARTGRVRVIRSGGGETAVYLVDLNAIRGGDLSTNILLASGDIVYVEPNIFARIGYAMNALLLPFQPFMGIANAFMGSAIAP